MTAPRSVFIVEDDPDLGKMLRDILPEWNFEPQLFPAALPAVEHLKSGEIPALMLLDVQLPDMNGVDVVREIRHLQNRPAVVLMTAHARLQTAIECMKLGAEDYITKPFDLDLLLITLERVLERQELRKKSTELDQLLKEHSHEFSRNRIALKTMAEALRVEESPENFDAAAQKILGIAHELLRSNASAISLRNGPETFYFQLPDSALAASHSKLRDTIDWVAQTGVPVVHGAPRVQAGSPAFPDDLIAPRESIFFPLHSRDNTRAAVQFARAEGDVLFSEHEIHLIELVCAELAILHANARLYENFGRMTIGAVTALANTLRHKDDLTAEHARRSQKYLDKMLENLNLAQHERDLISFAMRLHDIGKIRVPDQILNKPGPLNKDEWEVMRMHPVWGFDILNSDGMLAEVARLVKHHHERYDGEGYPDGLSGSNIPLGSRIMSVIDSFDAMRSNRPYRKAMPLEHSLEQIRANMGTQFDPDVAEAFLRSIEQTPTESYA